MSRTGSKHDSYMNYKKMTASDERCYQVYLGKRDLLAAWQEQWAKDGKIDAALYRTLKRRVDIAKSHLVHKGLI